MSWIFWAFVGAAAIHIVEEFVYPGGFLASMRSFNPQFASSVTVKFAVIINSLFLLLCVAGAIVASRSLVLSLSVASLLFLNALMHIVGAVKVRGYVPGVISGVLLYLPLSLYAYYLFASSGQLTFLGGIASGLLGVLYQAIPIGYLALSSMVK